MMYEYAVICLDKQGYETDTMYFSDIARARKYAANHSKNYRETFVKDCFVEEICGHYYNGRAAHKVKDVINYDS